MPTKTNLDGLLWKTLSFVSHKRKCTRVYDTSIQVYAPRDIQTLQNLTFLNYWSVPVILKPHRTVYSQLYTPWDKRLSSSQESEIMFITPFQGVIICYTQIKAFLKLMTKLFLRIFPFKNLLPWHFFVCLLIYTGTHVCAYKDSLCVQIA